ncbi:hypothetical protein ACIQRK_33620 [Streptomyces anulatus]
MAPEQARGRSAGPRQTCSPSATSPVYTAIGQAAFGEGNPEALFCRILRSH